MTEAATNVVIGVAKEAANIWIGMGNTTTAFTGWGKQHALFKESNRTQAAAMDVTADVAFIGAFLSTGKAQVGGVAIADAEETALIGGSEGAAAVRGTKQGGAITEPNAAPTGTVVNEGGVSIVRRTNDHAPGHLHVSGNGPRTRIGQNGNPLRTILLLVQDKGRWCNAICARSEGLYAESCRSISIIVSSELVLCERR